MLARCRGKSSETWLNEKHSCARLHDKKSMSELCHEFGISRKTGHEWDQRSVDGGTRKPC